jgi:hypothetical protein
MRGGFLLVTIAAAILAGVCVAEGDFPPPPMPKRPAGFNIYCDVCDTLMKRVAPYCERDEANLDYLPDFCVFNYNKVLRLECEYLVDVMEFAWCPSPCNEIRRLKSFSSNKICHHHLVNCTERVYVPSPSTSPSPSPSTPLPRDCVLCEYVLKQVSVMCMNEETANKKNIYRLCMEKTWHKEDFEHCMRYLNELVEIADTTDPCTMLSCENPQVACALSSANDCRVDHYNGPAQEYSQLGLDENGNFLNPDNSSYYHQTLGMGPSDFAPGEQPYHSKYPIRPQQIPARIRQAGHLIAGDDPSVPTTPEGIQAAESAKALEVARQKLASAQAADPLPVPLKEIKMQL